MNDRARAAEALVFDPARAGWTMIKPIGFGELIGPLWRRGDDISASLSRKNI
jgi:hypothetical protein